MQHVEHNSILLDSIQKPEFEIILMQQTPTVRREFGDSVPVWIKENTMMLLEFVRFACSQDNAAGIAANQVAWKGKRLEHRFFVYRCGQNIKDPFEIIIDPVITKRYGSPVYETEGCLTWPGMKLSALRFVKIEVSYWTASGQYIENKILNRFDSQVFQHEVDHLNGVEEKIESSLSPTRREGDKVGRNDQCPCGSLKKYKKCCGE